MAATTGEEKISLSVWFHPSMQMAVKVDAKEIPFKVKPSIQVVDLMDECEDIFETITAGLGTPLSL